MKLALGIILSLLALAAGWLALASVYALITLAGESPGMGYAVLLPLAVLAGVTAVGLGLGAALFIRGWARRDRTERK
jgi:hypothetical protein